LSALRTSGAGRADYPLYTLWPSFPLHSLRTRRPDYALNSLHTLHALRPGWPLNPLDSLRSRWPLHPLRPSFPLHSLRTRSSLWPCGPEVTRRTGGPCYTLNSLRASGALLSDRPLNCTDVLPCPAYHIPNVQIAVHKIPIPGVPGGVSSDKVPVGIVGSQNCDTDPRDPLLPRGAGGPRRPRNPRHALRTSSPKHPSRARWPLGSLWTGTARYPVCARRALGPCGTSSPLDTLYPLHALDSLRAGGPILASGPSGSGDSGACGASDRGASGASYSWTRRSHHGIPN
jgi:hypothetical protein